MDKRSKILIGQRFDRLVVLEDVGRDKYGSIIWRCQCDCGNIVDILGNYLRRGTKSCGCKRISSNSNKLKNIVGQRFGMLTVIAESGRSKTGKVMWECLCDCGQTVRVFGSALKTGNTKSCGCENRKLTSERIKKVLLGKRFGRWEVIKEQGINRWGQYLWLCQCDCGNQSVVVGSSLTAGTSQSCGCVIKEKITGDQHWNWKGGSTDLNIALRSCMEYIIWRRNVFNRDMYTCQKCGDKTGGNLCVHHIKSFSLLIEENKITNINDVECSKLWDLSNGVTLCNTCHHQGDHSYHVIYGKIAYPSDFDEWMGRL